MEETLRTSQGYDLRQYDRIWQRVTPGLEPYPTPAGSQSGMEQTGQTVGSSGAVLASARQESQLPGAETDPCCMGSAAAEMLEVLTGFVEEELEDQRTYLALARQAPAWARQRLRDIAADEGGHARRLMAVYYLITGQSYRPVIRCAPVGGDAWCPALRGRYHAEACGGLNYARAADSTTDTCLAQLLQGLSADEYRHANTVLAMLERSLRA